MKYIMLGFLLIMSSMNIFAAQPTAMNSTGFALAANASNANSVITNVPSDITQKIASPGVSAAPVDPRVAQETQNVFQNTADNLNLYVTQLQCQSQGINTNSCTNQNSTNQPTTMMDNVNKFLFNSVTSELGVGVEVHF
jgi:hypothetical protein